MTPPPDVGAAKSALRTRLLARRRDRPAAERSAAAAAVADALVRGLAGAGTIAAFCPDEIEPGHGRLPAAYRPLGARVLLPVVPAAGSELLWALDAGRLVPGRFGLLEPDGPRLEPDALGAADVVVVPALAVGRDGSRLGRGRGYYDRALRYVRPDAVLVAVVFDDELLDGVPVEPHDLRITAVVTPSGGWQELGAPADGRHWDSGAPRTPGRTEPHA